jgi:hypothetical protein
MLLSPALPVYARGKSDAHDNSLPFPPGVHSSLKVTMPPLPPGIPVPVPGSPVFVEKHREPERHSPGRDYGSNRHDSRDYRHNDSRWRNDRGRDWPHRPHGSVHRSLPAEAFALSVAGAAFFFHMGNYYRHTPTGYVVVQAPFGARVRALPEERCSTLYIDGRRYYNCDDVYYEPDGDEYVVIERPSVQYQAEIEVGDEVRVKAEFLNVRSGPGTRYRAVSKLYRGDIVEIGGMDGEWYYVRLPNDLYGWIMREHTRLHRSRHEVKG